MLPEELSNGLCSLKPNLDRLTLVCEMILDKTGAVSRYNFFEGLINSQARLTYNQVSKIISQRKKFTSGIRKQYNSVLKNIDALTDLYSDLSDSRDQRGSVEFESQESQIVFDAKKKIKEILPVERNQAHKLIEECMLCANVCAAKFLKKNKMPALYRVHPQPKDEKIENLKEFLGGLGIDFPGCGTDPKDYQRILGDMKKRLDGTIIQSLVLRSMNRAIYTPESDRHFGLNYPEYTHFTSPIRRYPDLLVHRAIRYLIRKKSKTPKTPLTDSLPISDLTEIYPYDKNQLISFGEQCSLTERRADDATRDVINWLKCEFLSSRIGEKFDGVISTVTGFGLFVQLDNMFVEGLIHVTSLPKDFYYFEEDRHRLVGEKTGKIFCLGDKLKVRVIKVELSKRKIDFELIKNYQ
jgi:ribonuclease R